MRTGGRVRIHDTVEFTERVCARGDTSSIDLRQVPRVTAMVVGTRTLSIA
jgi:hypothetical protein